MSSVGVELLPIPPLERPALLISMRGWFDMGEAATNALEWLSMAHNANPAASIDPELLFDFQEVRPTVQLGANGTREIHWPTNNVVWAKTPPGHRDLVLLAGTEPNLRWRSFGDAIRQIIAHTGAEIVLTVGSTLAMTPHTRAFPVHASTGDPELATRLKIGMPTYEGPTGLIGSLHEQLDKQALALVSLRVSVPHYVPGAPSPKASAALLVKIEQLLNVPTGHVDLADEIRDWESRVHMALAEDEEIRSYVTELERQVDDEPEILHDRADLSSEIERFLRGQGPENI